MRTAQRSITAALLVLVLALATGSEPALGQQEPPGLQAALGTGFTYQGELRDDGGAAINGTCDFDFSLWSAEAAGSMVGSNSITTGVSVVDGHFALTVNARGEFGAAPFPGDERWLQVAVRCPAGSGDYTVLDPRQALTPVPYALYAQRAGAAPWGGLTGVPGGFFDGVDNDTTYSAGAGIAQSGTQFSADWGGSGSATKVARSDHDHSAAYSVIGHGHWGATWTGTGTGLTLSGGTTGLSATGTTVGVDGYADESTGTGVRGTAYLGVYGDGRWTGVIGSGGDLGVSGYGNFAGVDGQSAANTGIGVRGTALVTGVVGIAATTGAGNSYGVYGRAASPFGYGTYGEAPVYGVYGKSTQTSSQAYGVYGTARSTQGIGVVGEATSTSGANTGVYARSYSAAGTGLYAAAPITGVQGIALNSSGETVGVYGKSTSPHGYGVYGQSTTGVGVYGESESDIGVAGRATLDGGIGVLGLAESASAVAGYFMSDSSGVALIAASTTDEDIFRVERGTGVFAQAVFRVNGLGNVQADGGYHCGNGIDNTAGDLNEDEIAPCLYDDSPADFAEMLPAAGGLEPGDVLIVGPDGELALSTEPYQSAVVGVYSTRPSYLGNGVRFGQEGYAPLAIAGLVPVKACAENGAIAPGDLLTTSSTPGHAMVAEPLTVGGVTFYPSGVIIGKALEALSGEAGTILVLVTLQ
ncbi:MAG: hypothetical protein ISS56_17900 [Anaerolineae bacterium]|nr:hypothetical protein [Anaerolineae bacterium]